MRTTLAIDDDVLVAARALARQQSRTLGAVISDLVRQSLPPSSVTTTRNGIPLLSVNRGGEPVTLELINALRDDPS